MKLIVPPIHQKRPHEVLLFLAILKEKSRSSQEVEYLLENAFGPILCKSNSLSFSHLTSYYKKEMGDDLEKNLVCFKNLAMLETVYESKLISGEIERTFSQNGKRKFNLDPGYLVLGKTHMLTTKDFSHRVYIKKGIFGEVNLIFSKESQKYEPWERTYKDFHSPIFIDFLTECRSYYKNQIGNNPL